MHHYVYVTNYGSDTVSVMSGSTIVKNITLPKGSCPDGVAFNPSDNQVYVADFCSNSISIVKGTSLVTTFTNPVFHSPLAITFDPFYNDMVVINFGGDSITFLSGTHVAFTVKGDMSEPDAIAYAEKNATLYIASFGSNSILSLSPTGSCFSGGVNSPFGLAYDPANGLVYVTEGTSSQVGVMDPSKKFAPCGIVATINVGITPEAVAFDPNNLDMYVTCNGNNKYYEIGATNTVVAVIGAGSGPIGLAFNQATDKMYIVDSNSDSVKIVK